MNIFTTYFLKLVYSRAAIRSFPRTALVPLLLSLNGPHVSFYVTDVCWKLVIWTVTLKFRTSYWVVTDFRSLHSRPHLVAKNLHDLWFVKDLHQFSSFFHKVNNIAKWCHYHVFSDLHHHAFQLYLTKLELTLANELQAAVACCS